MRFWYSGMFNRIEKMHMITGNSPATSEALRSRINDVILRLGQVQSAATVSALALRKQNADCDGDVASVVRHSVIDPIQNEIEELESITEELAREVPEMRESVTTAGSST
jgi:hypothetical protein